MISEMVSAQEVYKVVNEDGTVMYTDIPVSNSLPVELGPDNRMVSPPVPRITTPTTPTAKQRKPSVVTVIQPDDQATIRNNAGNVQFAARVTHTEQGDKYQLYVNGELKSEQSTPLFNLSSLPRGAHSFYIVHNDNKGKTLASSTPRTFYLHQASRFINNN